MAPPTINLNKAWIRKLRPGYVQQALDVCHKYETGDMSRTVYDQTKNALIELCSIDGAVEDRAAPEVEDYSGVEGAGSW